MPSLVVQQTVRAIPALVIVRPGEVVIIRHDDDVGIISLADLGAAVSRGLSVEKQRLTIALVVP